MMQTFAAVAVGGAAGSVLRHAVGLVMGRLAGGGFPVGVLTVNIVGSFAIGLFLAISALRGLGHLSPLLVTGFLGGFTTFSAFSAETVGLWERGAPGQAVLYVALSVAGAIGAAILGLWIGRQVAA